MKIIKRRWVICYWTEIIATFFLSVAWESLRGQNPGEEFLSLFYSGAHKMSHRIHVWGPVVLRPWSNVSCVGDWM